MPFAFAGIWDTWTNRGGAVTSCGIITTAANELVGELHDRMPAMLQRDSYGGWLDPKADSTDLRDLLRPFPASKMKMHPVSIAVNHPENDNSDLLRRVDTEMGTTPSLF